MSNRRSCCMSAGESVSAKPTLTARTVGLQVRMWLASAALCRSWIERVTAAMIIAASLCTSACTRTGEPMKRQRREREGEVMGEAMLLLLLLACTVVVPVVSATHTSPAIARDAVCSDNRCFIAYVCKSESAVVHVQPSATTSLSYIYSRVMRCRRSIGCSRNRCNEEEEEEVDMTLFFVAADRGDVSAIALAVAVVSAAVVVVTVCASFSFTVVMVADE